MRSWEQALESKVEAELALARKQAAEHVLRSIATMGRMDRLDVWSEMNKKREKRMWEVIAQHLRSGKHKRVALVFGAWHSYELEPRLVKELGFKHHATWWQDALSVARSR